MQNNNNIANMDGKIITFKGYWTTSDVIMNPKALFIYGDNNIGKGKGGQAIIRDLPNTFGIPTKKYPSNNSNAYYTDAEIIENIRRIRSAINSIVYLSSRYEYVVLPENGFGTGLADLPRKAPGTYKYLVSAVEQMKKLI